MKQLTEVSETALITLRSRAVESQKANPILHDPVGEELFEKLVNSLSDDLRKRILERKLSPVLSSHIAIRARKFDTLCREFLEEHPDAMIVNLGAYAIGQQGLIIFFTSCQGLIPGTGGWEKGILSIWSWTCQG